MRSGRLKHRVTLQSPAGSRDALGERTTTWSDIAYVYAAIEPLRASELIASSQYQMNVTHKIIIRYDSALSELDNSWRILFGTRIFVIEGITNFGERNIMLELLCSEGMREE